MNRTFKLRLVVAPALFALLATRGVAHEKDFVFSTDWVLPARGERELEAWSKWWPQPNEFQQLMKFEYGVTDAFTIEPVLEFTKLNGEAFKLEAAELEAYFHFRDFGYGKLLPALEAEVERRVTEVEEDEEEPRTEVKLRGILSLYTDHGEDFTVNTLVSRGFNGDENEWEGEFTAGYLRPLDFIPGLEFSQDHPLKVGVEFRQSLSEEHNSGIGPVVTWRATESIHVLFGGMFALNHRGDENFDELRLILEWEF